MFSKATEYAIRACLYIARKSSYNERPGVDEISKAIGSPRAFTAKVLQQLSQGGKVLGSARGPGGGFFITESNQKLPLREILIAMSEQDQVKKCIIGLKKCSEDRPCPLHHDYRSIKRQLIQLFETKTIADLANETDEKMFFLKSANR